MKKLILILLLAAAPLVVTQTGCQTSQLTIAYKSLASTQAAVDTARKAFLAYYHAGKVSQEDAAKAMQASLDFNAAFNAAVLISHTTSSPTPENVAVAANAFLNIVSQFIK